MRMTCFLVARDQVTLLRQMVEHLSRLPLDLIILDHDSDNEELLTYYDTKPCRVIRFHKNHGARGGWGDSGCPATRNALLSLL